MTEREKLEQALEFFESMGGLHDDTAALCIEYYLNELIDAQLKCRSLEEPLR